MIALIVLTGCGLDTGPTAISLDGVPITTDETSTTTQVSGVVEPTTTTETVTTSSSTLPTTTLAPPTLAPLDPRPLALDVLVSIPVMRERGEGYDRELFEHWITVGGCSTRENVLIRDSFTPAQVDPFGCRVVAGDWLSPFDGVTWDNPADVDIDHVVALKEAWDSGAWAWSPSQRRAFANDLTDRRTLRAVTDNVNQSKGDKDPSNWMPPLQSAWCPYLADWIAIKARWQLSMDESEAGRIRNLLMRQCAGLRIDLWASVAVSAAPVGGAPAATAAVTPAAPVSAPGGDVYYANCSAARAAGAAPLMRGEPGYRKAMDRDDDGVACE